MAKESGSTTSLPTRMITDRTARQVQRAIQSAYAFDANVDKISQELAATSLQTPMSEAILQYDQA